MSGRNVKPLVAYWVGTTVTVTGPGVHRDVPIGASATYSVKVPAGRYTLVGHSPLYGSGARVVPGSGVAMVTSGANCHAQPSGRPVCATLTTRGGPAR